jgi:hypothetical protein
MVRRERLPLTLARPQAAAGLWTFTNPEPVEVIREDFPHPSASTSSPMPLRHGNPTMRGQNSGTKCKGQSRNSPLRRRHNLSRLCHARRKAPKSPSTSFGRDPVRASEIRAKKGIEESSKTGHKLPARHLRQYLEKREPSNENWKPNLVPIRRATVSIVSSERSYWTIGRKHRKDEIDLNFSAYGPGVLTLSGKRRGENPS